MMRNIGTVSHQLPAAETEQEKTVMQRQIEATDKQIDTLVYELYGLTEEEIKIVDGKEKSHFVPLENNRHNHSRMKTRANSVEGDLQLSSPTRQTMHAKKT